MLQAMHVVGSVSCVFHERDNAAGIICLWHARREEHFLTFLDAMQAPQVSDTAAQVAGTASGSYPL